MAAQGRSGAFIVTVLIIFFSIINLGIGIGVTARYNQYGDVFRQPVGLAAFSIVVGLFGLVVGALSLLSIRQESSSLSRIAAICAGVLAIFAGASFISALALNSQVVSFIRIRLTYHMDSYIDLSNSNTIINLIQNRYACCGQSSWLDWAFTPLGVSGGAGAGSTVTGTGGTANTGTVTGTGTGTATGTGTGTSAVADTGRRRRHLQLPSSPLVKAVRKRRQDTAGGGGVTYGLPGYSLKLPASCCTSGQVSYADTIGGYCTFTAQNGTQTFDIGGCLPPVSDTAVCQITGIAVISIFLALLGAVLFAILLFVFSSSIDTDNPNNKQSSPDELQQAPQQVPQQNQYGQYYANNSNPNGYYNYNAPTNATPQYTGPAYTVYQ